MWIEPVLYIITFIISAAMAFAGIMISYQLYQTHQKQVLQVLLYQQIFLISFFIYGIWGNIALHEILADLNISKELENKLNIFIPVLGTPFLVISWLMLLRFALIINGLKFLNKLPFVYFPVLAIIIISLSVIFQKEISGVSLKPDLFIIRSIVLINFAIHFVFTLSFIIEKKDSPLQKEIIFLKEHALLYFMGILAYSAILWFYNYFGSLSICLSIIFLFAISISIPVILKLNQKKQLIPQSTGGINYNEFCNKYEISKRESEIILEICSGKTNKAISEKLFITLQTVKDHNYRIYSKLGVKTRIQLTNMVREKTGI